MCVWHLHRIVWEINLIRGEKKRKQFLKFFLDFFSGVRWNVNKFTFYFYFYLSYMPALLTLLLFSLECNFLIVLANLFINGGQFLGPSALWYTYEANYVSTANQANFIFFLKIFMNLDQTTTRRKQKRQLASNFSWIWSIDSLLPHQNPQTQPWNPNI